MNENTYVNITSQIVVELDHKIQNGAFEHATAYFLAVEENTKTSRQREVFVSCN